MSTLPTTSGAATLLDFAKSLDPNGRTATVVELLNQTNEILMDMQWIEGNLPTGHRSTIRTGLPTAIWRKLYQGVPASKSTRAQITDVCGMLEARSEVDKDLADLNGNTAAFRLSEAEAFIESMNQTMATQIFYGDATSNPDSFNGLAVRYSDVAATNGQNIIDAGGSGSDNTSVYLIVWGPNTVHGIFPKGSKAGLVHENLGLQDAFDSSNNRYRAYCDRWQWKCGLTVKDWRYVVRIGSIDVSDLQGITGTQALTASTNILKLMTKAMARIPSMGMGRAAFYANRTVAETLGVMAMDKSASALSIQDAINQFGKVSPGSAGSSNLKFLGVPIRTTDALLNTEAAI